MTQVIMAVNTQIPSHDTQMNGSRRNRWAGRPSGRGPKAAFP